MTNEHLNNSASSAVDVSVIVPLPEHRGHWHESIDSWAQKQTYERRRYEVIVVINGRLPEIERQIPDLLTPYDSILHVDSSDDFVLYDSGARQARGQILFFTEAHVVGTADSILEMVAFLEENPDYVGGCCLSEGLYINYIGKLQEMVYQEEIPIYSREGHWHRIAERGCALYKDVYLDVGGFKPQYHLFAERMLGIELHERGMKLAYVHSSRIKHWNSRTFDDIKHPTGEAIHGQAIFRSEVASQLYHKYFGITEEWTDRALYDRLISRSRLNAQWKRALHRLAQGPLSMELFSQLPVLIELLLIALLGRRWPRLKAYAAMIAEEWRIRLLHILGRDNLYSAFRRYWYHHMVPYFWHRYLDRPQIASVPSSRSGGYELNDMDDPRLVGFHAVETNDGIPYRWSRPNCAIILDLPADDYICEIKTLPMRHADLPAEPMAFLDKHALDMVEDASGFLRIRLSHNCFAGGDTGRCLVITCNPYRPAKSGSSDRRELGLAIRSIKIKSAHDRQTNTDTRPGETALLLPVSKA